MEIERLDSVVAEETAEIVIAFDKLGKVLYANRSAREKLDYTKEELEQCNMQKLFQQEFQQDAGANADFDITKLQEVEETVIYRKNSSCFPVTLRFVPVEEGVDCLLARDITWDKSMDMLVRQLKEEESVNLRVRNEFTANVTHELRTPVNGIKGHVTFLLDSIEDQAQRETLQIILYCCDNMSAIINNILDFSKMEAGKFTLEETEFDFYKMMDQVIATHMAALNKKELHVSVYIDENIPQFVIGDALRINQILNNLLSNAIKFTLVGQISVDVSKTLQINDEVELFFMVKDTGIGMTKEEQDKLFQSFQQVDASITRRFGGTGLGLSITKQLVEMMNGLIHVESEKGKGSCFSFSIRLRTGQNVGESRELSETYKKWSNLTVGMEQESDGDYLTFGSPENKAELNKRMEKLLLSMELGSWERAETMTETIKALTEGVDGDMKRLVLRLGMAVRKENYEKSMEAYEQLKAALAERLGD
ncbi:MAG: PAS domain-containing protein [Acetatifactor sp.]|nr:PAS domain-containing protein [Acetatifactor sp.]